jgi:hypothetical protein
LLDERDVFVVAGVMEGGPSLPVGFDIDVARVGVGTFCGVEEPSHHLQLNRVDVAVFLPQWVTGDWWYFGGAWRGKGEGGRMGRSKMRTMMARARRT